MKYMIKKGLLIIIAVMFGIVIVQTGGCKLKVQAATIKPDLTIHINDAPVLIENKDTDKISASYNSRYYDVSINQSLEGAWSVDISVINSHTNQSVILYIPNVEYNSVKIEIDNGMYSGGVFNAKSIIANVDNGGLDFSLSAMFDGSVEIDAYNSTFHLVSLGNYKNFNVEMISDSESLGSAPNYFDCVNGKYTYINGAGTNLMNISLCGGSVGSLE